MAVSPTASTAHTRSAPRQRGIQHLAVGESSVTLLHLPHSSVGVSIGMEREYQQK